MLARVAMFSIVGIFSIAWVCVLSASTAVFWFLSPVSASFISATGHWIPCCLLYRHYVRAGFLSSIYTSGANAQSCSTDRWCFHFCEPISSSSLFICGYVHISQCCSLLTGHPSCMDVLETQSLDHRKRPEAPKTVCESQRVGRIQCMMHSPFPLVFLFTISFSLRTMCICVRFLPTDLAFLAFAFVLCIVTPVFEFLLYRYRSRFLTCISTSPVPT